MEESPRQLRNPPAFASSSPPTASCTSSLSNMSRGSARGSRNCPTNAGNSDGLSTSIRATNSFSVAPNSAGNAGDATGLYFRGGGSGFRKQVAGKEIEASSIIPAPIVGNCPFMCPEAERAQRERLRDLAVFERLHGNPGKTSCALAVKKFCRTISTKDVQASDLRPLPVLEDTLSYLLNLLDSTEQRFEVVHDFIFDRMRSIRQDLCMQNIVNEKAIKMYEEMVKFHAISHHKLQNSSGSQNSSSMQYLNMEQLTKTLITLFNLYDANRKSSFVYENEAEFHSLYVLLHLGSTVRQMVEPLSFWFCKMHSSIIKSKEICFARKILRYSRTGNFKRFFSAIRAEASYLQYFILESYINEVRSVAVACINNAGYKHHPYPLAQLSKLLMMKEEDVEALCNSCGLETFADVAGYKSLPTKQANFCFPKGGLKNYSFLGFEKL